MKRKGTYCIYCDSDFEYSKDKKFCSKECRGDYRIASNIEKLEEKTEIESLKDYLYENYTIQRLSTRQISNKLLGRDTSANTISRYLRFYGIGVRQGSEAIKTQWENNPKRRKQQAELNKKIFTPEMRSKTMTNTWKKNPKFVYYHTVGKQGENNPMYGITGADHPKWNPELTDEHRINGRAQTNDHYWRTDVFERDNYTCQICKDDTGGNLVAHHINGWNWDIEGRHDVNNGITLCDSCHKDFHSQYGYGDNTEKQFNEYINTINLKILNSQGLIELSGHKEKINYE